jgi:hypothetical protein
MSDYAGSFIGNGKCELTIKKFGQKNFRRLLRDKISFRLEEKDCQQSDFNLSYQHSILKCCLPVRWSPVQSSQD